MEKTIKYSLEISTPATVGEQEDLIRQLQTLPRDEIEFIAITIGAGGSIELATPVLSFIQLLLECINVPIVPHVTGSHQTQAQVQELLRKLSGMGIQTVLAVRGDGEPNAFGHGDDLIRFIEKTGNLRCWEQLIRKDILKMIIYSKPFRRWKENGWRGPRP
ncbi:5,10-methylenetetrahydrofolate reductase [Weissella viridescens]|uniref:Methylenetetrahydrofolate reductase n=1 Tax=Weissella viridescens TaxID=1629 RepID=A0A380P1Z0_WEIVI|nr:5,10-methylenetetrahydrofolate reductase [Weissella viridescens]